MTKRVHLARPTKIELSRLKRRLKLAARIQKILKDRLSILIMEFLQTVKECATVKERLHDEFSECYKSLSITVGYHGHVPLKKELIISEMPFTIYEGTRNIAGVTIPLFEVEAMANAKPKITPAVYSSSFIDKTTKLSQKCLETVIELAELEKSLELLGIEINKVKRINNALEYFLIPGLEETIKYLTMKFEERDREEVARLKRVKLLIEQRKAYAY